jgi:Tfp pilus assembly protein PilN
MRAVNLIPGDQRSGASVGAGRSEGAAYALLALLVIVAGMALLYGKASRDISSKKSQTATLTSEAAQSQSQVQALAPYTSFVALREQRQQAVESLVDTRFDWAHAFHEFGRVLTNEVSINALDGTIGGTGSTAAAAPAAPAAGAASAGAASVTPAGSVPVFTINGCATSQKAVADVMQRLRLIDGVSEVTLQSSTRGSASGASGSGSCAGNDPVFTMTVDFDALPSASAAAASVKSKTVADSTSAASATGATSGTATTGGEAR